MSSNPQRGPRVVYVAGSVREFPEEVREWLSRAENRACASPNLYDALATLAAGRPPALLIVSMDAVDWTELDFFDHVTRMSPDTMICVAGQDHHHDKIEAACRHGARRFDAEAMNDAAYLPTPDTRTAGLLAGSLRSQMPARQTDVEAPMPQIVPAEAEPPHDESHAPPGVRLVPVSEHEHEHADEPIPFPWSPSEKRPKRTSPSQRREASAIPPADADTAGQPDAGTQPAKIELSKEELSALLDKGPDAGGKPAKEQQP